MSDSDDPLKNYAYKAAKDISKNTIQTIRFLSKCHTMVFDIIYQPNISHLLYLSDLIGLKTLSGKMMNLEQAVIVSDKATSATGLRDTDQSEVRKYMKDAG